MSGGGGGQTASTQFTPPGYTTDGSAGGTWTDYLNGAASLTGMPFNQYQGMQIAPLNSDQEAGMDLAYQRATFGAPDLNSARGMVTDTNNGMYLGSNPFANSGFMQYAGTGGGIGGNPYDMQGSSNANIANGQFYHADPYNAGLGNIANGSLFSNPYTGAGTPLNNISSGLIADNPYSSAGSQNQSIANGNYLSNPFSDSLSGMAGGNYLNYDQFGQGGWNQGVSNGNLIGTNPYLNSAYTDNVINSNAGLMARSYATGAGANLDAMAARDGAFGGSAHEQAAAMGEQGLTNSIGQMANQYQLQRTQLGAQDYQQGIQQALQANQLGSQSVNAGLNNMLQAGSAGQQGWNQGVGNMVSASGQGMNDFRQYINSMISAAGVGQQGWDAGAGRMLQAMGQGSQNHYQDLSQMLQASGQGSNSYNTQFGQALQGAGIGAQDWQNERGNMLNAANSAGQLSQDDWTAARALTGVGDARRSYTQDLLNNQYGMYQQQVMWPQQMLDLFGNALSRASGNATMGTSTQFSNFQPSPLSGLLGLGALGYGFTH